MSEPNKDWLKDATVFLEHSDTEQQVPPNFQIYQGQFRKTAESERRKTEIIEIAKHNPAVYNILQHYLADRISWEKCLESLVIFLAKQSEWQHNQLVELKQNSIENTKL